MNIPVRTPEARVREVIEIEFLRGAGVPGDPMRMVTAYRDAEGQLLAERDQVLEGGDGIRELFRLRGWTIHYEGDEDPTGDVYDALAAVLRGGR